MHGECGFCRSCNRPAVTCSACSLSCSRISPAGIRWLLIRQKRFLSIRFGSLEGGGARRNSPISVAGFTRPIAEHAMPQATLRLRKAGVRAAIVTGTRAWRGAVIWAFSGSMLQARRPHRCGLGPKRCQKHAFLTGSAGKRQEDAHPAAGRRPRRSPAGRQCPARRRPSGSAARRRRRRRRYCPPASSEKSDDDRACPQDGHRPSCCLMTSLIDFSMVIVCMILPHLPHSTSIGTQAHPELTDRRRAPIGARPP